jgi:hypothetical protein
MNDSASGIALAVPSASVSWSIIAPEDEGANATDQKLDVRNADHRPEMLQRLRTIVDDPATSVAARNKAERLIKHISLLDSRRRREPSVQTTKLGRLSGPIMVSLLWISVFATKTFLAEGSI